MARISQCSRLVYVVAALALTVLGCGAVDAVAAPKKVVHHAKVVHRAKQARRAKVVHHPKLVRHTASVSAAPATAAVAPAAPTSCADGDLVPTPANLDRIRAATLCLIGIARAAAGLPQLRETAALDAAAQAHTDDMVANGYFGHVGPTGSDLLDRIVAAGYAAVSDVLGIGENIAVASPPLATPAATVAMWMNSPEHQANILDASFTDTGLGVSAALPSSVGLGASGATYTECFGAAA